MRRHIQSERLDRPHSGPGSSEGSSWTEEVLVVDSASLYSESLEGKASYSCLLELRADPESSRNTRTRTEITLAFGLEEKDVTTFARFLGRKVHLGQKRQESQLKAEILVQRVQELERALAESDRKVAYLNNSLHQMVQESRRELPTQW